MNKDKPALKIVKVRWDGRTCFRYKDGAVTISAPPGKRLTNERGLWLLEKARLEIMEVPSE
jgi:hypothetical protein